MPHTFSLYPSGLVEASELLVWANIPSPLLITSPTVSDTDDIIIHALHISPLCDSRLHCMTTAVSWWTSVLSIATLTLAGDLPCTERCRDGLEKRGLE